MSRLLNRAYKVAKSRDSRSGVSAHQLVSDPSTPVTGASRSQRTQDFASDDLEEAHDHLGFIKKTCVRENPAHLTLVTSRLPPHSEEARDPAPRVSNCLPHERSIAA